MERVVVDGGDGWTQRGCSRARWPSVPGAHPPRDRELRVPTLDGEVFTHRPIRVAPLGAADRGERAARLGSDPGL